MNQQKGATVALRIDGMDEILWAEPRPEDQERLTELLGGGPIAVSLDEEDDTEGHAGTTDVILDVEGHAIALRLPTTADAAALRRGFAMGVVTASLVVAGAAAAVAGADLVSQAAADSAPPAAAPAQDVTTDTNPPVRIVRPQVE